MSTCATRETTDVIINLGLDFRHRALASRSPRNRGTLNECTILKLQLLICRWKVY